MTSLRSMSCSRGLMTIPVIVVDDEVVVGFDQQKLGRLPGL